MTDHRDEHEPYAITPPPAISEAALRLARQVAEWQEKCALAIESSRLSEAEVRRLRVRCEMEASHIAELKEQIKTLRAERDEARREVSNLNRTWAKRPQDYAIERGWDCFREPPLDRLAKLDEECGLQ